MRYLRWFASSLVVAWIVTLLTVGVIPLPVYAQDVNPAVNIFTNQTLTNSYIASSSIDVQSWDSISLVAKPGTLFPAHIGWLKYQWSQDNSTWADEPVLASGTATSTEQPYTFLAKTMVVPLASPTINFTDRLRRQARYFRVSVQSTNVVTSATLSIDVQKMQNAN